MDFFRAPFFLPWLYPQLTWRVETLSKELYITFDDGPVPGPTEFVLEELRKWKAQATFFCIGENIKKHPTLFKQVIAEGHAIGNHTFNHLSGWKTGLGDYLKNIQLCEDQFKLNIREYSVPSDQRPVTSNQRPAPSHQHPAPRILLPATSPRPLFRPPYGRITRQQIKSLQEYKIVMWEVLTHDYAQSLSPARCLNGSIAASRPGSIVVFHDSVKAEKNMTYVLPRFIEHFAKLGYAFKSF